MGVERWDRLIAASAATPLVPSECSRGQLANYLRRLEEVVMTGAEKKLEADVVDASARADQADRDDDEVGPDPSRRAEELKKVYGPVELAARNLGLPFEPMELVGLERRCESERRAEADDAGELKGCDDSVTKDLLLRVSAAASSHLCWVFLDRGSLETAHFLSSFARSWPELGKLMKVEVWDVRHFFSSMGGFKRDPFSDASRPLPDLVILAIGEGVVLHQWDLGGAACRDRRRLIRIIKDFNSMLRAAEGARAAPLVWRRIVWQMPPARTHYPVDPTRGDAFRAFREGVLGETKEALFLSGVGVLGPAFDAEALHYHAGRTSPVLGLSGFSLLGLQVVVEEWASEARKQWAELVRQERNDAIGSCMPFLLPGCPFTPRSSPAPLPQ